MKQQQTSSSSLDNGGISLPYSSSTPNLSKHAIVDGISQSEKDKNQNMGSESMIPSDFVIPEEKKVRLINFSWNLSWKELI